MTLEIDAALKWADEVWELGKLPAVFGDVGLTMSERSHIHTLAFECRHAVQAQRERASKIVYDMWNDAEVTEVIAAIRGDGA